MNINEKELFKYDPSNEFYSDICLAYSTEFQTDITIKDRQEEFIDKNLSLCEEDCDYNDYDINTKKVICNCNIKISFPIISDIIINKEKLKMKFKNIKEAINLKIMKCYKLLFVKEGIIKNIGNFILLFIILIFIICTIIFPFKSYNILYTKIKVIYDSKNNKNLSLAELNKRKKNIINQQITEDNNHKIIRKRKNKKEFAPKKKKILFSKSPKIKKSLKKKKNDSDFDLSENNIIKKDSNNSLQNDNDKKNKIMSYNDNELNRLEYEIALISDKRTFGQYFISLLKTKHMIFFTFFNSNDYNSLLLKICLFFFFFASLYTVNALFFTGSIIHEIYLVKGEYNFVYQLPQIIISSFIISIINIIVKYFSLTEKKITKFKNERTNGDLYGKMKKLINLLKIQIIIFYIISYIFLIFFWYYLSCFCAVYKNTQIYLIKDTIISFGFSLIYPFPLYLIPGIFRFISIKNKNNENKCLYNISLLIQSLL